MQTLGTQLRTGLKKAFKHTETKYKITKAGKKAFTEDIATWNNTQKRLSYRSRSILTSRKSNYSSSWVTGIRITQLIGCISRLKLVLTLIIWRSKNYASMLKNWSSILLKVSMFQKRSSSKNGNLIVNNQ